MWIMTAEGWKQFGIPATEKREVLAQDSHYHKPGSKITTWHGKWWEYSKSSTFDKLFKDADGDRRNGDGTLRPNVSGL